ncbi:MAG TPA: ATP-dependent DNA ligase [Polyangia bacterium]|jgi:DNA ligase-1|nr:ATP-dependent DNA ligase [Polyangia bacterium]
MKRFADLYEELDRTTSTQAKVAAMAGYFRDVPAQDGAWAVFLLTGRRFKRLVATKQLVEWTLVATGVPEWLLGECYGAVGDLAETMALLLDGVGASPEDATRQADAPPQLPLSAWIEQRILGLRALDKDAQAQAVMAWWRELGRRERYLLCKLLTGELRVGVSQILVTRALAEAAGLSPPVVAHRLMGAWEPTPDFFRGLLDPVAETVDRSRPYPFFLASPLEGEPAALGDRSAWQAEWKWDGIRAQVVRRDGEVHIWSRGEELVTERYPEVRDAALTTLADGVVIDGELLAYDLARDQPLPFAVLQKRIGRQKLGPRILAEAPVALVAYDLLEFEGQDWRDRPLQERRRRLEELIASARSPWLRLSPLVEGTDWDALLARRDESRARGVEGLMLKRLASPYGTGRKKGDWWKWKIAPLTFDAVLVYAQAGHGKRASLFTDYTFAVWRGSELVPVAKAYSGLDNAEIAELDRWIRGHTRERFGPVRVVDPVHVFELGCERIAPSPRHKSGVAVRFPRILRWRRDKTPEDADTLEQVVALERTTGEPAPLPPEDPGDADETP